MSEYEAMKAAIRELQDEVYEGQARIDGLTHDLKIARETITDVARVRDDFFESLSARDAEVVTLEAERDTAQADARELAKAFQKARNGRAYIVPDCLDKYLAEPQGEDANK